MSTAAAVHPMVEEQTVHLNLEDDPYIYQSSTRYYVQQPYAHEAPAAGATAAAIK